MFISVIVPTRNRYDYIRLLLVDLLDQDVDGFEVIVVDQSDNHISLENCKQIKTKSLGPCVSRNIGASQAKGEVLVFLDDDARINSDFIREITAPIIKDRFHVVAGAICNPQGVYLEGDDYFLKTKTESFIKAITSSPIGPESRITLAFPAGCSAMLRSVFYGVGGFNESFDPTGAGEDREMAIKLYKKGYSIWYNAKAKLMHEAAPSGGSREVGSRSLMLDVHTYKICQNYFSEELANELKQTILNKYRKSFFDSVLKFKLVNTKYRLLKQAKQLLN